MASTAAQRREFRKRNVRFAERRRPATVKILRRGKNKVIRLTCGVYEVRMVSDNVAEIDLTPESTASIGQACRDAEPKRLPEVTPEQDRLVRFIDRFMETHHKPPTLGEIARGTGMREHNVATACKTLWAIGALRKGKDGYRRYVPGMPYTVAELPRGSKVRSR